MANPPFSKRFTAQPGKKAKSTPGPTRPVSPPNKVQRILGNPDQTLERVHVGIYDALDRLTQSVQAANVNVTNIQGPGAGLAAYTTIKLASSAMPQRRNLNFAGGAVVVDNPVTGNTDVTITAGAITGTGDVTWPATSGTAITTLARIPNDTPALGDLLFTVISAPAAPVTAGRARVYVDAGSGMLSVRATGVVTPSITVTPSQFSSFWVNGLDNAGNLQYLQALFSNIGGSVSAAQLPAFTGDVTKPAGSTVQTLANIPNDVPAAGDILFTNIALPANPGAGTCRLFADSTSGTFRSRDSTAAAASMAFNKPVVTSQWLNSFSQATGQFTSLGVNFTDLAGSLPNSQLATMPSLTLKGNNTGGTAIPSDLNAIQFTAMLNFFSSTLQGAVPASGGGTTNFLRADGTWAAPPGGGGGITGPLTGDVTTVGAGGTVTTLANIPNDAPAVGDLLFTNIAAPSSPAAGKTRVYVDSTSGFLASKNQFGSIGSVAFAQTAVASQWLKSFSTSTGAFTTTQPAFTDISGTLGSAQFGPLTGDVTTSGYAATLKNIPTDTPAAGDILFTNIAAPATPAAGKTRVYVDSTSKNLAAINDAGTINHGVQTKAFTASNFLTSVNDAGVFSAAQPNFTDLAGSAGAAQAPGRLKSFQVLTSGAGATYTRPAGIGSLIIEAWGGGGGGGGVAVSAAAKAGAGGGGGAGAYCKVYVPSPTATMTYTIGTSGSAGTNLGGTGGSGGNTTITDATNTITCNSGTGGLGATPAAAPTVTTFGAGGTFSLTGAGWTTLFSCTGNPGSVGHCSGTASTTGWGGHGGTSGPGGGPGQGGPSGGTGIAGTAGSGPGAGGGGGCNNATGTGAVTGGAGSTGRIVVWEFSS